jgi:hypothetical protein
MLMAYYYSTSLLLLLEIWTILISILLDLITVLFEENRSNLFYLKKNLLPSLKKNKKFKIILVDRKSILQRVTIL